MFRVDISSLIFENYNSVSSSKHLFRPKRLDKKATGLFPSQLRIKVILKNNFGNYFIKTRGLRMKKEIGYVNGKLEKCRNLHCNSLF